MNKKNLTSPFAPLNVPNLPQVNGVKHATMCSDIKESGLDLAIIVFDKLANVAGVFTNSETSSAPVSWCKSIIKNGLAKALIINSGNANAFTGYPGGKNVTVKTALISSIINCRADQVFVASTGVIGEQLPIEKILNSIPLLIKNIGKDNWSNLAQAIRTTDTYPKLISKKFKIEDKDYVLNGIAKGSGMISPNMGTLLGFFFTDADIPSRILDFYLKKINEVTFNAITVDGDSSTSDTLLLFSTGEGPSHGVIDDVSDPRLNGFINALKDLMLNLSHQVIKDGEGASKFITIEVINALTNDSAKIIGNCIAKSPLVKTAIAGEDPNWGRIIMAIGNAQQKIDKNKLKVYFGNILVAKDGGVCEDYIEELAANYLKNSEVSIKVDIGEGNGSFTVWTCDFTEEYIKINSDYRS
ncbi:MAG: Arginine biosynthesis bifunctional protein ArgJ [Alphaproteobacteria bacterium MarineAlpha2_Bin1]|nr:MAG: Arginine biosynthesis bifunctional protein ArgJ [Alphaproteobacteria bacterium MarineAlpha2_Bin1]|tara:strand:- start:172 stop:1410 length:1239 start_codon:yes stop_codon:yes gene_type:complete